MKPLNPLTYEQALQQLIEHILGKDWYVVDPLGATQINAIAVEDIKSKFDKLTYRRLRDKWNKTLDKLKL